MKPTLGIVLLLVPVFCTPAGSSCLDEECHKEHGHWIIQKIGDCPEDKPCTRRKDADGNNHRFDPELDKRKNIWVDDPQEKPAVRTIKWMKDLERHPTNCNDECPSREKLKELGEGKKIMVVAWALTSRKGSQETANCDIPYIAKEGDVNTDNHIVLVEPSPNSNRLC